MATDINYFLESKYIENQLGEAIRTEKLYDNIPNVYEKYLFAVMQQEFNRLFGFMYRKQNGHFNAQESRELIYYIKLYEDMKYVLNNTNYNFTINEEYEQLIKMCNTFLSESGGSTIPNDILRIRLLEYEPIFKLNIYVEIKSINEKNNYELKLIGQGSYAQVFKYKDENYDKNFIIKRAKKNLNSKELFRFKKEFNVMKELKSPYILEVYRYDDNLNQYFAEYADETILDYITKNNDKLSKGDRKKIVYQILQAFSYIHSKDYLHRDISLTNVLLIHYDDVSVVKISDFGLVKEKDSNLTSIDSDIKGSLNDSNLEIIGFENYSLVYETYALTRLIMFIMTGKKNLLKVRDEKIIEFVSKGTNSDIKKRFKNVDELKKSFNDI